MDFRNLQPGTLMRVTFAGDLCLYSTYAYAHDADDPKAGEWIQWPDPVAVLIEGESVILLETEFDTFTGKTYGKVITPYGVGWIAMVGIEIG